MRLTSLAKCIQSLVSIPRVGWIQRGVPLCEAESVGDHTLLTTFVSWALCRDVNGIDCTKVIRMALIHDLHEVSIGNVAGHVRRSVDRWHEVEISEFESLVRQLGLPDELVVLFREYRRGQSVEAKLVTLSDKIATLARALQYRQRGYQVDDLIDYYRRSVIEIARGAGLEKLIMSISDLL